MMRALLLAALIALAPLVALAQGAPTVFGPTSPPGITPTGAPANGNLAQFSGARTITNGDLSGDCTTSATLVVTCLKTNTVAFGTAATASAGTLPAQASTGVSSAGKLGEFATINNNFATCAATISNANPAVVTCTNSYGARCTAQTGVSCIFAVNFTGLAGSNGIANNTAYYVDPTSTTTAHFQIATSVANALAGTDVATTGTDSGTATYASYLTTSGTIQPILALNLTAGSWDCWGGIAFLGVSSTAPTRVDGNIYTIAASADFTSDANLRQALTLTTGAQTDSWPVGKIAFSFSAATLVYLQADYLFTGGATNPTIGGRLSCRRGA